MIMSIPVLTPAQAGIVKLAAAEEFKRQRVAPATADYVFARYLGKCAQAAKPAPSANAVKLAGAIEEMLRRGAAAPAQA